LKSEEKELQFIKAFRNLMRILNVLRSFSHFAFSNLYLEEQQFEDYKSKYLDLFDMARSQKEGEDKASIIYDIDFELELIQRDEINVAYILRLLAELKADEESEDDTVRRDASNRRKSILLGSETQLRSKRELIERFINEQMSNITTSAGVEIAFGEFWGAESLKAFEELCSDEGLESLTRSASPAQLAKTCRNEVITMPAKSKAQQMAAGGALAAKRGEKKKSELKGASKSMVESMSSTKWPRPSARSNRTTLRNPETRRLGVEPAVSGGRHRSDGVMCGRPHQSAGKQLRQSGGHRQRPVDGLEFVILISGGVLGRYLPSQSSVVARSQLGRACSLPSKPRRRGRSIATLPP
jgi:Type I restriction and modification enzyme - subunit R C terminal/Protein of unknwon function (DUF3008)